MPDYHVMITASAPLVFSENKPGGIFQKSLPYVPGAILRGALAGVWLAEHGDAHEHRTPQPGCDFCAALMEEEAGAVFTNAYPIQTAQEEPFVLPATAVACKNHGRFPAYLGDDAHPVFDTLIERLCWERLAPAGFLYMPTCPTCGERVETYGGLYAQTPDGPRSRHVQQRLLTRVAINRRRNVAEDGMLYSPFVVDEVSPLDRRSQNTPLSYAHTRFRGRVRRLPETLAPPLERITHLGGSASRGLGQVRLKVNLAEAAPEGLGDRLQAFATCLAQTWDAFARLPGVNAAPQPDGRYFTLTLQSDAILTSADGRPMMIFDADMLRRQIGLHAELVNSYASYNYIGGWNAAWGLPKPTEVIVRMGSTYLYRLTETPAGLVDALTRLEQDGIGRRRCEGFGQVRVAHEFHTMRRNAHVSD